MRGLACLLLTLGLASCAAAGADWQAYLQKRHVGGSTPESVRYCHGYGCRLVSDVTLNKKDWRKIVHLFKPPAKTPEKERQNIAKALGLMEKIAGAQTGTQDDQPGTFRAWGDDQLDCIDESTNTTTFLSLLEQKKLMRHHRLLAPTARLPIVHAGRWPHQTAVIAETDGGAYFAVDSWFGKNGDPADIVALEQWKDGWKPQSDDAFY